jgi:hypothetical protein
MSRRERLPKLKRDLYGIAIVVAGVITFGCGGSGAEPHPTLEELAGSYVGTWARVDSAASGTIACQVSASGLISGTTTDSRNGNGIILSSSYVVSGGHARIVPEYQVSGFPLIVRWRGRLSFDNAGHLVGTLNEDGGDIQYPTTFDLVRQ